MGNDNLYTSNDNSIIAKTINPFLLYKFPPSKIRKI